MNSILRFGTLALALVLSFVASRASAQGAVTLDQFHPAETAEDGFTLSRPDDRGHLRFGAQLTLDFAYDPLVYEPARGSMSGELEIVRNQLAAHVGAHIGLFDRLVLFIGLPVNLLMDGATPPVGSMIAAADGAGLGDASIGARVRLFGERADVFALALQAYATLPTAQWASERQSYAGERGATIVPELLGELRFGGFRITLNVGARLRVTDEARIIGLTVGHELTWGAGLTIPFVDQASNGVGLTGHLEVFGASSFSDFAQRESSPVEGLLGLRIEPVCGLYIGLGAGTGFTRGYGSPDVRGLLSIGFSDSHCTTPEPVVVPEPEILDSDHDGILDPNDECVNEPEDVDTFEDANGCPDIDNDQDTVLDVNDGAPLEPEDLDGFEDTDGIPDLDNDHDGIPDASDACPVQPEDVDTFQDTDGCPDIDNDRDNVLDVDDECPLTPGTVAARGCSESVRLDVETGTIVILQRVEFATNRDVILDRSFPVLLEVAGVLVANPQLMSIRIEGHTDDRGRDARNLDLSRRRASSVLRWLVEHGVDASRLAAWGCGELHPLDSNTTSDGRQANRRVEFHIVSPAPASGPHQLEGCVEAE